MDLGLGLRWCQLQAHAPNTALLNVRQMTSNPVRNLISCICQFASALSCRTWRTGCRRGRLTKQLLKSCSFAPERACDEQRDTQWPELNNVTVFLPLCWIVSDRRVESWDYQDLRLQGSYASFAMSLDSCYGKKDLRENKRWVCRM